MKWIQNQSRVNAVGLRQGQEKANSQGGRWSIELQTIGRLDYHVGLLSEFPDPEGLMRRILDMPLCSPIIRICRLCWFLST